MKKRSLVLILSLLLVVSGFSGNVFAAEFPDMPVEGYWSTAALEKAVENGLLTGFEDGQIKPKANLERAQMAAVINRAFDAKEEANLDAYTDVKATDWFYPEMAKAVAMGTFKGDAGKLDPNDPITREQAFIVIARALDVEASVEQPEGFTDLEEVATWANKEVYALVNGGYVEGSAGKLNPKGNITREEFAQLMHNIIADYNLEDGQEIDGNAMINKADTVLKDATIKGDLVIGDGVAEGDVTLDNVTVEGRLLVRGGGVDSILIKGKSNINSITTSKVKGAVRVAVEKEASAGNLTVRGDDVIVEGKFKDINIVSENIEVNANKASAETVSVKGAKSKLVVGEETTVKKLVLEGKETQVDVAGKVTDFVVDKTAETPKINVKKGGQVDKMEVNTEATVAGEGKVTAVKANANNVKVNTVGTKVSAAEGTTGVKAGNKEVEAGQEVESDQVEEDGKDEEDKEEETTPPVSGGGTVSPKPQTPDEAKTSFWKFIEKKTKGLEVGKANITGDNITITFDNNDSGKDNFIENIEKAAENLLEEIITEVKSGTLKLNEKSFKLDDDNVVKEVARELLKKSANDFINSPKSPVSEQGYTANITNEAGVEFELKGTLIFKMAEEKV